MCGPSACPACPRASEELREVSFRIWEHGTLHVGTLCFGAAETHLDTERGAVENPVWRRRRVRREGRGQALPSDRALSQQVGD